MPRNLDRRIELLFPIESLFSQKLIRKMLDLQLVDTCKGRKLNSYGSYPKAKRKDPFTRSQIVTYQLLKEFRPKQNKLKRIVFEKKIDD